MTLTYRDEERVRDIVREEVKDEVKTQLTTFRSEIMAKLDKILGLMLKRDQEVTVLSKHSKQHTDKLTLHHKRLTKLEKAVFAA